MEEEELRLAFEKKLGRGRADSTLRRRSTPGGSSGEQNVLQVMPSEQFAQARIPIEKMSHEMQQQLQQELHQQNQQQQVEPGPGSLPPEFSFDSRGLRRCPLKNLAQNSASIPTIPFFVPITMSLLGPMVYQLMLANAVFCGSGNIEAHQAALGFKTGEASMGAKLPDGVSQGQSFEDAQKEGTKINYGGRSLGGGGEVVPMRTLDSYNISNLSFIKTDVQGSENLLIWGARETILR
eukprot:gene17985-24394_t